ncbi:hypothetical protein [Nocardia seriolae]|nr:hypothetical protein [Nocardia seriolae]MTJ63941.1 hypothetical protein [Nocardia seriolae]MTJ71012.1 hypothetical protein [Nocardia seriolae]MTJ88666.1 hypothetical protein [Nocardia seriolae]MTK32647.1 hypothetical protein [Nocardia seriolae]MTK41829.1 hypothetical protein [Nocardia seriolae]
MKISVSLPDDRVTELIKQQPNVSDFLYRAARRMLVAEELAALTPDAEAAAFAEAAEASTSDAWAAGA